MSNISEEERRILLAQRVIASVVTVEGFLPTLRYVKMFYDERVAAKTATAEDHELSTILDEFIQHVEDKYGLPRSR